MWGLSIEVGLCVPKPRPVGAPLGTQTLSLSPKGAPGLGKPCPGHSCGRRLRRCAWEIGFQAELYHEHLGTSQ